MASSKSFNYKIPTKVAPISAPIDEMYVEYIFYYNNEFDGKNWMGLINTCGLSSKFSFHDVRIIEQNEEKLILFTKKNISYIPSIYECKTGKVFHGHNAFDWIEKQGKQIIEMQMKTTSVNRILVMDHASKQVTPPAIQDIITKLDDVIKRMAIKDIEDAVFKVKVLTMFNKSASSAFQPAVIGKNMPRDIILGSSKLAQIDSRSPPSSPPAIGALGAISPPSSSSSLKTEKKKVISGLGKMMDPIIKITPGVGDSSPTKIRAAINIDEKEEERKSVLDAWQRICDGDDSIVYSTDEIYKKDDWKEPKRDRVSLW